MMFLQYALWGAWLPVTARYLSASQSEGGLGFSGSEIGMILGLAGIIHALLPFIFLETVSTGVKKINQEISQF